MAETSRGFQRMQLFFDTASWTTELQLLLLPILTIAMANAPYAHVSGIGKEESWFKGTLS
jgi:hypothetical protein